MTGDWRELRGDQMLEMANKMLDQQGEISDLKAKLARTEMTIKRARLVLRAHENCRNGCDLSLDLREVLGDDES